MNVAKHLLNDIKPLRLSEQVRNVLDLMEELKFSHLPFVDDKCHYLGLISEDDLLEIDDEDSPVGAHQRVLKPYAAKVEEDLFSAIKTVGSGQLSLLPAVDEKGIYKGYISPLEIIQDLGRQLTFSESGSILVLDIPSRDYQLSQITQIIESEDARITGFLLNASEEMDHVELILKINQKDLGRILKSFERYNYVIKEVFHESIFDDTAAQRYASLMNYLKM